MKVSPHWTARVLIAGYLAAEVGIATAAPLIPSSELPGRERERFTESPVERFMGPGPYVAAPVISPLGRDCKPATKRHSKPLSTRRKNC